VQGGSGRGGAKDGGNIREGVAFGTKGSDEYGAETMTAVQEWRMSRDTDVSLPSPGGTWDTL